MWGLSFLSSAGSKRILVQFIVYYFFSRNPVSTTSNGPTNTPECLPPPGKYHGDAGDPCVAHSGCLPDTCLICVRKPGQKEGICKSVTCKSDTVCQDITSLPSECTQGQCAPRQCLTDKECPQGMKCFEDGNCKTVS